MLRAGLWHRGQVRLLTIDPPVAGKDWAIEMPQGPEGVQYEPLVMSAIITDSAGVANRNFNFFADNGAARYARWGSPNSEVANATVEFVHFPAASVAILINPTRKGQQGSMPWLRMPPGHRIVSETGNMDAADQWTGIRVLVQEWLYEPPGEFVPNAGDGAGRVDVAQLDGTLREVNEKLMKLMSLWQGFEATP